MLFAFVFGAAFSFSCFNKLFNKRVLSSVLCKSQKAFCLTCQRRLHLQTSPVHCVIYWMIHLATTQQPAPDSRPENIIIIYRKKPRNSSIWHRIHVHNTKPLIISFSLFCLFYFFETHLTMLIEGKILLLTSSL